MRCTHKKIKGSLLPMLLYVDKKKERQKKIKRLLLIIGIICIVVINFINFPIDLNHTKKSLLNYTAPTTTPQWYTQTTPVTILSSLQKTNYILIIPQELTRENLTIIAKAFSQIPSTATQIYFTPEISQQDELLKLAQIFIPSLKLSTASAPIIVSSNEDEILALSKTKEYTIRSISYNYAKDINSKPEVQTFLNTNAPLPPMPQNKLEQEKANLTQLVKNKKDIILSTIPSTSYAKIDFPISAQYILLKNTNVCLSSSDKKFCTLNNTSSLKENIKKTLKKFTTSDELQTLSLLTSLEEINPNSPLSQDEGLIFRFGIRKQILLPQEIKQYNSKNSNEEPNVFRYIKQQAGINPDYNNPEMKFYKFKTVEININDNI